MINLHLALTTYIERIDPAWEAQILFFLVSLV